MNILRLAPRFRTAYRQLATLAERESWSRPAIESWQLQRLNAIWKDAWQNTRYYQRLRATHALPEQFNSLQEFRELVPTLSKEQVRDHPDELLSGRRIAGRWHQTGGSTGAPTRIYWPCESHFESLRARYRCIAAWNVDPLERHAMLWGHAPALAPGLARLIAKARRPVEDKIRGRLRLSAYRLGEQDLSNYLRQIERFQPAWMYGYPSAVYLLAEAALRANASVKSLKFCMLSGEPAYARLRHVATKAFDAPTVVEYGSVECGVIAHESPDGTLRVREDMIMLETVPREDGNYDIAVTSLINPAFPLLRYLLGDLSPRPLIIPDRGFAVIEEITGRSNDMLVSRSGRLVHPLCVKHVLESYSGIRRFRAKQDRSGQLHVLIETSMQSLVDERYPSRKLSELLGGYPVHIEFVSEMPSTAAGKHRWVMSDMVAALS
ncbi:MAG: hypothetical protein WD049_07525 [Candidatus Paceibacterota bacterium]